MAITLQESTITALTKIFGNDRFNLSAGDRLRIQKRVSGETIDLLDETVEAGKEWSVVLDVDINETDA